MEKVIAGKTYTFMEVDQCKEFNCQWFNDYDEKCTLSGAKVINELLCSRYVSWLKRKNENKK